MTAHNSKREEKNWIEEQRSFPFTFVKVNNNEGKSFSQDVDFVQNCKELYQA